jgi:NAD(P)-dependent dehydrogenase (short-subunit alcohol dehydrogenase family)
MSTREAFGPGGALVFGGSGGIGRAVCERLADSGSDVALTYRTNAGAAEEVAATIRAQGRRAETFAVSAGDEAAMAAFVEQASVRLGGVHTVVYAAGSDIPMRFASQVTRELWREVMEADATAFFDLVKTSLPHLRVSHGALVAVTSAGLRRFPPRDVLSVAPKAAMEALVRAIAKEEGRFGVRANCVALGVIEAGIFMRLSQGELGQDWIQAAHKNTPLRRFGTADEAADAVCFLASRRASYVTGQTLVVDGGYSL